MSALVHGDVLELAARVARADGRERAALIKAFAASASVSVQTVYRALERAGVTSGRARRRDAGRSAVPDEALEAMARIMATGRNKWGEANIPLTQAFSIARENGLLEADVTYEHVARLMRQRGLDGRRMRAPGPSIARVSTHPNHIWMFDISTAIQWYFRDESGKKLGQYTDAGARFYVGKMENIRAIRRTIHRFAAVDHYSGAYFVRYYYTPGESVTDVVDFLERAMAPKAGDRLPLHGIPRRMVMDQGPANKSAAVVNLLRDLGVDVELHAPGNARATGAVEKRHDLWQRTFEGRLSLRPAEDLDELNRLAELACAKMCEEVPHTRHGLTPSRMWLTIRPDQLREPPPRDVFLGLAASTTREGTLNNYCWLRHAGRKWLVKGDGVYPTQKVRFRVHPFLAAGVRVWDLHDRELEVEPLEFDAAGFPVNGARHVWDDEQAAGAKLPTPPAQRIVAEVAETPMVVASVWDDLTRLEQMDIVAKRRGAAFEVPAEAASIRELDPVSARLEVSDRLGRALTREENAWWSAQVPPEGITRADFEALFSAFSRPELRAVGER